MGATGNTAGNAAKYVIALDQGTTSSRAVLIDREGRMVDCVQRPFQQIFPQPGWVEHNPQEILFSQLGCLTELIARHGLSVSDIDSIGIDNQRETTIVWDPSTGQPVMNAIVWQCRRTAGLVDELCGDSQVAAMVRAKTGLLPDAYFSASKIRWILDNVAGARERAEGGELLFGTVDTWLIWVLTGGLVHATDPTNASRTMLYNIHEGRWDEELLRLFDIPASMMPEVRPSSGSFGETSYPGLPAGIPIAGVAGDQQAALFGQCCFAPGQAKNTYGTGCFMLLHTGHEARTSSHNLVTTVAASSPEAAAAGLEYALEGSVFVAGALIQWLRDELGIIGSAAETEALAKSIPDTGGVYIVPAFTGLGAPWWEPDARGAIFGLTRGTGRAQIARAALEVARLPGERPRNGDGRRRGRRTRRAQRGRRRIREQLPHAVPGRPPGLRAEAPPEPRDDLARRGLPRGPRHRILVGHRRAARPASRRRGLPPQARRRLGRGTPFRLARGGKKDHRIAESGRRSHSLARFVNRWRRYYDGYKSEKRTPQA